MATSLAQAANTTANRNAHSKVPVNF